MRLLSLPDNGVLAPTSHRIGTGLQWQKKFVPRRREWPTNEYKDSYPIMTPNINFWFLKDSIYSALVWAETLAPFCPLQSWDLWDSHHECGYEHKKNPKPTFRIQTRASVSLGKLPGCDEHQLSLKRTKFHTANCSTRYSTGQTFETAYSRNKGICENSFKADKQHVSTARGLFETLNPAQKEKEN